MKKEHLFQVNLEGVLDVLSNHLYSGEHVFVRELLQNACDAIRARQLLGHSFTPEIHLELLGGEVIVVEDNGIGLTEAEVQTFLSSIGSSTKRESIEYQRQQFIGQFGIGLLSCFMVSESITLITKSPKSDYAIKWIGNTDGTYIVEQLEGVYSTGTKVYLRSKQGKERFFTQDKLASLIEHYGDLLPYSIRLTVNEYSKELNAKLAPWEEQYGSPQEIDEHILTYGKRIFELPFEHYIPLYAPTGKAKGIAYILPHAAKPGFKYTHRVYLKRMLLSDSEEKLMPDWAFFVKCIVNTEGLRPTASRETFYENEALIKTRAELGQCIRNYLFELSRRDTAALQSIIRTHHDALKSLALQDDEFFDMIIPFIEFPSTLGPISLTQLQQHTHIIKHIPHIDKFRQIAPVATAQGIPVINSGFIYDADLLRKLAKRGYDLPIEEMDANNFIQIFDELTEGEEKEVEDLIQLGDETLQSFKARLTIKKFDPNSLPALYYMSEGVEFLRRIEKSKEETDEMWGGLLDALSESAPTHPAQLCLNYHNTLIQKLLKIEDRQLQIRFIRILYVNALLMGHYPLSSKEMEILNTGLVELIEMSMNQL